MLRILLYLNLIVALASAVAALVALVRPHAFAGTSNLPSGGMFYVRMYAARSVPFGVLTATLPFWLEGPAVAFVLFTAALIQVLDVVIGLSNKNRGMATGASLAALVHFLCGLAIRPLH